jgi:hypothetical protein
MWTSTGGERIGFMLFWTAVDRRKEVEKVKNFGDVING